MSTLLLRLAGPMQSWGTQSRFGYRDTEREPSKSGVIGLLCAALGRPRTASVDDLAALRMGVRVDREGVLQTDYHTVGGSRSDGDTSYGVAMFDGSKGRTVVSYRRYLADAAYLVGFEARSDTQERLLGELDRALAQPVWPLFLGRKAFVPSEPIRLPDVAPLGPGLRQEPLDASLLGHPWPAARKEERLRFVLESETPGSGESRLDVPVSFAPLDRRYLPRFVETTFWERPTGTSLVDEE
jgi:CRISPR system Cascade subunit CasD